MNQLGLGCDGLSNESVQFGLIAIWIGASVLRDVGEEQRVCASALRAIDTVPSGGVEGGVGGGVGL